MDSSLFNWSNALLMDSLTKKPVRRSRRLLSKLPKTSTPHRPMFGGRKFISRKKKANDPKKDEWKQEYNTWNMISETLKQHLAANHQLYRSSDDIGILNGHTNNIQLIHDRQQFNQLELLGSNGLTTCAKDLIHPNNDSGNGGVSLKLKFRLIPVIESITVANNGAECSYTLDSNNNVATDLKAASAMEMESERGSETDTTLLHDTESCEAKNEFTDIFARYRDDYSWPAPNEYMDFDEELRSKVSSSLDSGFFCVPMCSTPKKKRPSTGIVDNAAIIPTAQKLPASSSTKAISPNARGILGLCKGLKDLTGSMRNMLNHIENACSNMIGLNFNDFRCDFSLTGKNYLSNSINV